MITKLFKHNQTVRVILLLTITCITTLLLIIGSLAFHVSSFLPFSFAHAATTCATTKGTQQDLCEQQNPVEQGCTQDAHSIEVESVYTSQNKLIGEVDIRHSALCKTFWMRTIAYANAQQVEAIDAIISFHTGKVEDVKQIVSSSGQQIIARTNMVFVPLSIIPTNWKGMFHLKGQAQPITIPI